MPSVTYQLQNVHIRAPDRIMVIICFIVMNEFIWRLGQKMSCETLEFSLSVVADRHLCILTYTGPPRPQSGQSEIQY